MTNNDAMVYKDIDGLKGHSARWTLTYVPTEHSFIITGRSGDKIAHFSNRDEFLAMLDDLRDTKDQNAKLQFEVERLRAALTFYAEHKNWEWNAKETPEPFVLDCGCEVARDCGRIAREALTQKEQKG